MGPSSFVQSHRPSRSISHSVSYSDDSHYPLLVSMPSLHSPEVLRPTQRHSLHFQSQLHTSRLSTSRLGMSTPTKKSLHGAWPVRLITPSPLHPFARLRRLLPLILLSCRSIIVTNLLCTKRPPVRLPLTLFFPVGRYNVSVTYARLLGHNNGEQSFRRSNRCPTTQRVGHKRSPTKPFKAQSGKAQFHFTFHTVLLPPQATASLSFAVPFLTKYFASSRLRIFFNFIQSQSLQNSRSVGVQSDHRHARVSHPISFGHSDVLTDRPES